MSAHAAVPQFIVPAAPATHGEVISKARPLATSLTLLAADVCTIFLARALLIATWRWLHPSLGLQSFPGFWESLALFLVTYAALGLYAAGGLGPVEEMRRAAMGALFVCLLLTASLIFMHGAGAYSRALAAASGLVTAAVVPLGRALARRLFARQAWWGVPVVVLGAGRTARLLIDRLNKHPEIGWKPVACLDDDDGKRGECARVPVAGPLSLAPELAVSLKIRHALVAMPVSKGRICFGSWIAGAPHFRT